MNKRIGYSLMNKPGHYYRSHLSVSMLRTAMSGSGWLTAFQVSAMVSDRIPPEAKARIAEWNKKGRPAFGSLDQMAEVGLYQMVLNKLNKIAKCGGCEKHGIGKDAKFRWIEKNSAPKADPA